MNTPSINFLGADGRPLLQASAHESGDRFSREQRSWNPPVQSADQALLPEMSTIVGRTQDMVRNYGLASGAVQTHLNNVIGSGLRLAAKPDYRALGQDADWSAEWAREVESAWRQWANDVDQSCDAGRRLNFAGMLGQGYRSFLTRGEIMAVAEWLPDRGTRYATAIQMVAPERVCNPQGAFNGEFMRAGIDLDAHGAAVRYHVRSEAAPSLFGGGLVPSWRPVDAHTAWGRRQFLHIYEQEEAGQTRGKSKFAAVLPVMKMQARFEKVSLEAAVVNAMYVAVIESDLDNVMDAMGGGFGGDANESAMRSYTDMQTEIGENNPIKFDGGGNVVQLSPNERLKMVQSEHPTAEFGQFQQAFIRQLAAGLDLSYEQLSKDYSQTNYSGARAGLLESWRFFQSRRQNIGGELATQIYCLWLEEAMDQGAVSRPPGAPDFYGAKTAWTRSRWIGPGKSHIDPLKEGKADALENDRGWLTQEDACANRGSDWEENLHQIARERQLMKELDLEPAAIGQVLGGPAEPEVA